MLSFALRFTRPASVRPKSQPCKLYRMEPGLNKVARGGIVEFRCGRVQKSTARRCAKLLRKGYVSDDGFAWLARMAITTRGGEPRADEFATSNKAMSLAMTDERLWELDGKGDRWTFRCHRRCGNGPTITKDRAADLATDALARGERTVYL